jgi:hypothetical protein
MIEKTIRIDFFKTYETPIEITQGTKDSVIFHFVLTGGSLPIDLTSCTATFYAKKPDGNIVFNSCSVTSAATGKADYTVTEQTAILDGDLDCWIVIIKTGETLHSQQFVVTVKPVPDYTAAVESSSEFTTLEDLAGQIAQNETDIAAAEAAIIALTPEIDSNANGTYIKYPDGRLECYKNVELSAVAMGSITTDIYRTSSGISLGSFAHEFIVAPPCLSVTIKNSDKVAWCATYGAISTTSAASTHVMATSGSAITALSGTICVKATGYWE